MLQVFKIQAAGFMSKITFAGSSLSCVHLQSWRRQSGDHESSPVSRVTLIGQTSPFQFIARISFQSGFCVPENNRRLAISTLGRAIFIILVILVSFCMTRYTGCRVFRRGRNLRTRDLKNANKILQSLWN